MQTNGIYLSLVAQLDKLARHNRQGSYLSSLKHGPQGNNTPTDGGGGDGIGG